MAEEEGMKRSEELARRAAELAARAEELARTARDAGEVEEELLRLEAELASLDAEQERVERALGDYVHPPEESEPVRRPDEGFTFRLGDLGERIADIVNIALGSVKLGAADVVEHSVHVGDDTLPLVVDSFAGSITVVTGDAGTMHVVAERRALDESALADIEVQVERRGEGVHVTARNTAGRRGRCWVQLTITVPRGTPTHLQTRGGSVKVEGTGAEVRAQTAGGSVKVSGTAGHADLETSGGNLRADDHDGPVTARTVGGAIKLNGRLPAVEATTIGGSIKLDGVDGPAAASTKGGSITVTGRLSGTCSFETAGGSISVALLEGTNIEVDASGTGASADIDGLVATGGRIEGRVGTGADGRLVARTHAGSVRIRRG